MIDIYESPRFNLYKQFCTAYGELFDDSSAEAKRRFASVAYAVSLTLKSKEHLLKFSGLAESAEMVEKSEIDNAFKECLEILRNEIQKTAAE